MSNAYLTKEMIDEIARNCIDGPMINWSKESLLRWGYGGSRTGRWYNEHLELPPLSVVNDIQYVPFNSKTYRHQQCPRKYWTTYDWSIKSEKEKEMKEPIRKFRTGDTVECVDGWGVVSVRTGEWYEVLGVRDYDGMVHLRLTNGSSNFFKPNRFKLIHATTTEYVTGPDFRTVEVEFNTGAKPYTYHCPIDGVKAGDYVAVPDRMTSFEYAIVKVIRVHDKAGFSVDVVAKLDTSAEDARREKEKAIQAAKNKGMEIEEEIQERAIEIFNEFSPKQSLQFLLWRRDCGAHTRADDLAAAESELRRLENN